MVPRIVKRAVKARVLATSAEMLAARLTAQTEHIVQLVVTTRGAAIATAVEVERLQHPGITPRELAELLVRDRTRFVAATGAVTALPGVIPGWGTAVEVGAALADAATLLYNQVALILGIAHAYGRDLDDHEGRKFDVILTLALEAGIAVPAAKTLEVLGERVALGALPKDTVAAVNKRVGAAVARRIAQRRAKVILGRELPLGVGVAIGAGFNYWATRKIGQAAIKYFEMG
jgi:hypothetical protein